MKRIKGRDKNGRCVLINIPSWDTPSTFVAGSLQFGAPNQFLTISTSSNFAFSTGSFTVEWFQKQTYQTTFSRVFTIKAWPKAELGVSIESGVPSTKFYLWMDALGNIPAVANAATITAPYLNQWDHYAVVRQSGSYIQIFRNGAAIKTITAANYVNANINNTTSSLIIGGEGDNVVNTRFSGSITNFRMLKGVALYSSSYAVPIEPLPVIPGSVLLLLAPDEQYKYYDECRNNSVNGNSVSESVSLSPFFNL